MAKAITAIETDSSRLERGPDDIAEALQAGTAFVKALHRKGVLSAATAAVEQADAIVEIVVDAANQPGATAGVKTFIAIVQGLARIDATLVGSILQGLASAGDELQHGQGVQVQGVWDLMKALRDPEISAGVSAILTVVKQIGAEFTHAQDNRS